MEKAHPYATIPQPESEEAFAGQPPQVAKRAGWNVQENVVVQITWSQTAQLDYV